MKRMMFAALPLLLLAATLLSGGCQTPCSLSRNALPPELAPDDLERTLAEVLVTRVETDRVMPWRTAPPTMQRGYGVAIASNLLLTAEELVRNNTLVEVRFAGMGSRVPARVVLTDPQLALALIEIDVRGAAGVLRPLPVADTIRREARHTLAQRGAGDQLQRGVGTITSIAIDFASSTAPALLTYDINSDLRAAQIGTPVLCEGQLAGLVLRFKSGSDASLALAPSVIKSFIDASRRTPYVGPPSGGFAFAALVDPVRRRYLGVPDGDRGVLITGVREGGSADGVLLADDVLLAWDGFAIDNLGLYIDPLYGRQPLRQLISRNHVTGDTVPVDITRTGATQRVAITLRSENPAAARIPDNAIGAPADYLIEGGLLFRELTADYLQAYGNRWLLQSNSRLAWEYVSRGQKVNFPDERLVILSLVLPDPINIGYQNLRDEIVSAVNGAPVTNLCQMAARIAADGGLSSIELDGWKGGPLRLDTKALPAANTRIREQYRIPALSRISKR